MIGPSRGADAIAAEMGLEYIPDVPCAPTGPPLADTFFKIAEERGTNLLLYVASDVILTGDLLDAIAQVPFDRYLLTGRRRDLDIKTELDFSSGWEQRLLRSAKREGRPGLPSAVDYLLYTAGIWVNIPPFAMGRMRWDNYLVYRARELGCPVVDASRVVTAVHQNHDRSFLPPEQLTRDGPDDQRNLRLLPAPDNVADHRDATWVLTRRGIRRTRSRELRRSTRTLVRSRAPAALKAARWLLDRAVGRA